jgi:hypothetical protein
MKHHARTVLLCIAASAAALALPARDAAACTCTPMATATMFDRATDVFVGTVVAAAPSGATEGTTPTPGAWAAERLGPAGAHFEIDVAETLKGRAAGRVQVETPSDSTSCGHPFHPGERTLVFARRTRAGLHTDVRMGTTAGEGLEPELQRVRAQAAFLHGTLRH